MPTFHAFHWDKSKKRVKSNSFVEKRKETREYPSKSKEESLLRSCRSLMAYKMVV